MSNCQSQWTPDQVKGLIEFIGWSIIGGYFLYRIIRQVL
jgi:hypothetical protein